MITTLALTRTLCNFHARISYNLKNCYVFSNFNYFGFLSCNRILTSHHASSVGGSAMHMKCPDDVGREAAIGRTQDWKELKLFRACL